MQAIRLLGTGDLRGVDALRPVLHEGELLVQIEAAGVCGTDRHLFLGEFPCTPPVTLGHEFAGIVVEHGPGVAGPPIGARITCDPNIACGACTPCREGRINLCLNLVAIGVHRDGGFAEYAAIPAHRALPLPDGLDPAWGAFCEPLACTLHGADLAGIRAGERVAVLGGGVIGLLAVQLAALGGAETMIVTRTASKRALATTLGAAHAAASPDELLRIWPDGAHAVIECAGVLETVAAAPRLASRGGRVLVLGVLPQGSAAPFEPFDLLFREVSILTSFLNPFTQSRAVDLIASGRVRVEPLISRRVTLAELPAVIAAPPLPGEVKVLACPA